MREDLIPTDLSSGCTLLRFDFTASPDLRRRVERYLLDERLDAYTVVPGSYGMALERLDTGEMATLQGLLQSGLPFVVLVSGPPTWRALSHSSSLTLEYSHVNGEDVVNVTKDRDGEPRRYVLSERPVSPPVPTLDVYGILLEGDLL